MVAGCGAGNRTCAPNRIGRKDDIQCQISKLFRQQIIKVLPQPILLTQRQFCRSISVCHEVELEVEEASEFGDPYVAVFERLPL